MQDLHGLVRKYADLDEPLLITGEVGTGKSELARAIHDLSGYSGDVGSVAFAAHGLDLLACGSAAQQALTRWQIQLRR